jgi:hypothetical protein
MHERITRPEMIYVVPYAALPLTIKGNVGRRAVEDKFRAEIEATYASSSK